MTSPESFAIPEQAVRPLGTLHLTIGVMSLLKDEEREKAVALLKELCPSKILASIQAAVVAPTTASLAQEANQKGKEPSGPLLSITLKGLHSTAKKTSDASVLFASPVDTEGTLLKFCENLRSAFQEAGLMAVENRPMLLHATILNTIYVKGRKGKGERRSRKLTIDARGILSRYDDFVWMEDVPVEKIAICRMGAKKQEDGDEAYEVEAEIDLV